jgi:Zn-dependent membrane protease YugP
MPADITTDGGESFVPKAVALGLSIVCFLAAAVLAVAGYLWAGLPFFAASVVFDVLFVIALRAERRSQR